MTSHDLQDRDGFLLIYIGVQDDLTDRFRYITGGAAVTRRMIRHDQIVVDGFRLTDHADVASDLSRIA